jgi:hypothetical protein
MMNFKNSRTFYFALQLKYFYSPFTILHSPFLASLDPPQQTEGVTGASRNRSILNSPFSILNCRFTITLTQMGYCISRNR